MEVDVEKQLKQVQVVKSLNDSRDYRYVFNDSATFLKGIDLVPSD